jgi:methyl-accepting chemotaxis protein
MNLDNALQKHIDWKVTFRNAISRQMQMDVENIAKDSCCELGKWLHSEGKVQYGQLSSYETTLTKHAAFHIEAGKIASAINEKKYIEAEAMLLEGTAFLSVSDEVAIAIMRLKIEVAQKRAIGT